MQKGYLKPEQLDEAQKVANQTNQNDIGKVLVSLNMVGEREVIMARAQEMGYQFADLDRVQIDSSAINVVPERLVKLHNSIPVKKEGQNLWIATTSPNNIAALDDLRMASGCKIIPVLAVPGALEDAIKKYYGGGAVNGNSAPAETPRRLRTRISGPTSGPRSRRRASSAVRLEMMTIGMRTPRRWPSKPRSSSSPTR
jgi:type IV pilus assembly protein PilB